MKTTLFLLLLFSGFFFKFNSQTYTTGVINLSTTSGLAMSAKIDVESQVTLTLTGPVGRWFSIGFNASSMASGTDIVSAHAAGTLSSFDCNLTGYSAPVSDAQQNWTITSDVSNGGVRTIVATRALNTGDPNDYVFSSNPTSISLIWARSSSATYSYSYHGGANRGVNTANFTVVSPPEAPTGNSTQTLCSGATLAQLSATGTTIQWYASTSGGSPLSNTTVLVNGNTYYATQTVSGLESTNRLAVSVVLNNIPSAPGGINGDLDFCYDASIQQYTINSVQGATSYFWTIPSGSSGSSIGTSINLLFSPSFQSGTLTVKAENNCGQSPTTSIILNQHLPFAQTINVTTCIPYDFNGQTLTQSGSYTYQDTTIWGCDSTILLNLNYNSPINETTSIQTCGSYSWNGQSYFSSGIYIDTFQTNAGCDSIVTLDLSIYPIEAVVIDTNAIDVFSWNGIDYNTSGTYTQFFSTVFGCDSSVTINLTILDNGLTDQFDQFSLYPNPVGENQTIYLEVFEILTPFSITNENGQIVQKGSTTGSIRLNSNLKRGIYFLHFQNNQLKIVIE
jgi:hypothetical protein